MANGVNLYELMHEFWKENDVFNKSITAREGGEEFSFYDGPPTANGKPHVGHVLTRTMKDIIPRFHTMKGKHVCAKRAGIRTVCPSSWKWKSRSISTANRT